MHVFFLMNLCHANARSYQKCFCVAPGMAHISRTVRFKGLNYCHVALCSIDSYKCIVTNHAVVWIGICTPYNKLWYSTISVKHHKHTALTPDLHWCWVIADFIMCRLLSWLHPCQFSRETSSATITGFVKIGSSYIHTHVFTWAWTLSKKKKKKEDWCYNCQNI